MTHSANPRYQDRATIQRRLMSIATRVNDQNDQSLLVDAANWMSKYGLAHAAIEAVIAEAERVCDDATFTALLDAKDRAIHSAIAGT